MRIALVTVAHEEGREPASRLAQQLAAADHRVVVEAPLLSSWDPAVTVADRLHVRRHDVGVAGCSEQQLARLLPKFAGALGRVWGKESPDVVHADTWLSGLAATAAARDLGIPLVVSSDGGGPRTGIRRSAEEAVARRADRLIVASEEERFRLLRAGARFRAVRIVAGGVDTEVFCPHGPGLRRSNRPRLVALGGLGPDTGTRDAVVALRRLADVELLVAGGPVTDDPHVDPDRDPDLLGLAALARSVGVARRVRFLGRVPRRLMPRLLRSADVLVHVPHRDGSVQPVLEAMASGRAVVASAVGALREVVLDQVSGILVPPGQPDMLATALQGLLGQRLLLAGHGAAGRDRAVNRYSWPTVTETVLASYREAIASREGSPGPGLTSPAMSTSGA